MATPLRNIRVANEVWEQWAFEAAAAGVSRSEWIRSRCNGTESGTEPDVEPDVACRHPKKARASKGYATFCDKAKGGCGAKLP